MHSYAWVWTDRRMPAPGCSQKDNGEDWRSRDCWFPRHRFGFSMKSSHLWTGRPLNLSVSSSAITLAGAVWRLLQLTRNLLSRQPISDRSSWLRDQAIASDDAPMDCMARRDARLAPPRHTIHRSIV